MSKTKLIASIIAIASLSSVAAADAYDAPLKKAAAPQTYNWSGLYLGGQLGYGFADIGSSFDLDVDIDTPDNFLNRFGQDRDGWMGGSHIGLQHQRGKWIFDIEGTYDALDIDGSSPAVWNYRVAALPGFVGPVVPPGGILEEQQVPMVNGMSGVGTQSLRAGIDNLITITGGVGYAWDRWLAYLKGTPEPKLA